MADAAMQKDGGGGLPSWVPDAARHYLAHVTTGAPIRALARDAQVHASTILRQVRRLEAQRDDPLVDAALHDLARHIATRAGQIEEQDVTTGSASGQAAADRTGAPARVPPTEARILREGLRILRRLNEAQTVLAVARDMEMGVVVREMADGSPERLAVVACDIAQAMALKDWIACADPAARIIRYRITAAGRQELRRAIQSGPATPEEAPALFGNSTGAGDRTLRHMRSLLGDSPVTALARRRMRNGEPYLSRVLVTTGERLREDFELSQSGPRPALDFERFLTLARETPAGLPAGAAEARARLVAALTALGPGLGDAALRCCCFLEGLETVEEQMGWSARSGKVVLRIALDHLQRHYEQAHGRFAPPIG